MVQVVPNDCPVRASLPMMLLCRHGALSETYWLPAFEVVARMGPRIL